MEAIVIKILTFFGGLYLLAAYFVSRGSDGNLMATWTLLPAIGIVCCCVHYSYAKQVLSKKMALQFLIAEFATVTGILSNSQLDEMAGMLYFFIPIAVAIGLFSGLLCVGIYHRYVTRM